MALNPQCRHAEDVALFIERINMTGAVWVNDVQIWRDASLIEPLSRSWNMPRSWQIPGTLLDAEDNTVWVQVVGLDFHQPGLGKAMVGTRQAINATTTFSSWMARYGLTINLVVSGVVGMICMLIWVMRRREKAFGWYGLASVLWVLFGLNSLATTAWPFSDSLHASLWNTSFFVLYVTSFCLFTWRFGRCHFPKTEKVLLVVATLIVALLLLSPRHWQEQSLGMSGLFFAMIFFANCIFYQFHAWKTRQTEDKLLAVTLLLYLAIGIHTWLHVMQIIKAEYFFIPLSGLVGMVFMSLMLAWVFVRNIRTIEHAAEDLKVTVEVTTAKLTDTLQQQHTLEMQNVRLKERLQIAQDLHDGFGSSLVRSIALVELKQESLEHKHYLSILKSIRDDLRQVIDNTAATGQQIYESPAQWIAPIRRRFGRIFEELAIQSSWQVPEQCTHAWSNSQLMDLTRFVEEALTNVIKHSKASHVSVVLATDTIDDVKTVTLTVSDNGVGFDVAQTQEICTGIGMQSMKARIQKLGGQLEVSSSSSGTVTKAVFRV